MPSSYRIIKNRNLSVQSEQEIPVQKNLDLYAEPSRGGQAESLLKIARQEANRVMSDIDSVKEQLRQKVIEETAPEIEALKEAGREAGYQEGHQSGFEVGRSEGLAKIREEQSGILLEARSAYAQAALEAEALVEGVQDQIVSLSVKIAEEIINKSLSLDDSIIKGIAEKVLGEVRRAQYITIRICPEDRKQLEGHLGRLQELIPQGLVSLAVDTELKSGDCVVETESQIVRATIDGQLERLEEALKEVNRT